MDTNDFRQIYETTTLKGVKVLRPNKKGSSEMTPLDGTDMKNSIFLAGPCPRGDDKWDWRDEAIKLLQEKGFKGTVINPTNPNFDSIDLDKQTKWEYEGMHKASAILFWIDRSEAHPAFTTNIEAGEWFGKKGVFVGFPKNSWKNNYFEARSKLQGVDIYHSLDSIINAVLNDLNRPGQNFFTSDTHFGAQRTLDLSRRPFKTVEEMDLKLISNWNKTVRQNDTVYHLGDFGESWDYLNILNYKKMILVYGNYECRDIEGNDKALKKFKDVEHYMNDEYQFSNKDHTYFLRHEPLGNGGYEKDNLYLFGHIHGKSSYKRNGIDVGIDTYGSYSPLSEEEVEWRVNATLKYVDENVFTDICK